MGRIYEFYENIFQDYLFTSIMCDVDVSDKEYEVDIYVAFNNILKNKIRNGSDLKFLDFNIKRNGSYFKVIGNNIITALWLSNIFPINVQEVIKNNEYKLNDIEYKFNEKTKKLTF